MGLHQDFSEIASYKAYLYYGDCWVRLLESPEYNEVASTPLQQLVLMTTT